MFPSRTKLENSQSYTISYQKKKRTNSEFSCQVLKFKSRVQHHLPTSDIEHANTKCYGNGLDLEIRVLHYQSTIKIEHMNPKRLCHGRKLRIQNPKPSVDIKHKMCKSRAFLSGRKQDKFIALPLHQRYTKCVFAACE